MLYGTVPLREKQAYVCDHGFERSGLCAKIIATTTPFCGKISPLPNLVFLLPLWEIGSRTAPNQMRSLRTVQFPLEGLKVTYLLWPCLGLKFESFRARFAPKMVPEIILAQDANMWYWSNTFMYHHQNYKITHFEPFVSQIARKARERQDSAMKIFSHIVFCNFDHQNYAFCST